MDWREFWNRDNSIYANDRHRTLHDIMVARDMAALIETPDSVVLDFGCGQASSAALVASTCARLYLFDAAPSVREALSVRFSGNETIVVLGAGGVAEVDDSSLDLVVVNSVLQYLSREEFEAFAENARRKLKPSGRLVLADIIPAGARAIHDVAALLKFAAGGGFLVAALGGLVTTFFSDYRKLRAELGLTRYTEDDMVGLLATHGFGAQRAAQNLGHNQSRMMFVARRLA